MTAGATEWVRLTLVWCDDMTEGPGDLTYTLVRDLETLEALDDLLLPPGKADPTKVALQGLPLYDAVAVHGLTAQGKQSTAGHDPNHLSVRALRL